MLVESRLNPSLYTTKSIAQFSSLMRNNDIFLHSFVLALAGERKKKYVTGLCWICVYFTHFDITNSCVCVSVWLSNAEDAEECIVENINRT